MNTRIVIGCAASIFAISLGADAKLVGAPGDNGAKFSASGPAGLSIVGQASNNVAVAEDGANLKVSVALKDLDTGIPLRNKHMREKYLEVEKFPSATLVVARAQIQVPAPGASGSGSAAGQMTIHGQTHPVTVAYSAKNNGGTLQVTGTLPLNMNDFGIQVPSYLGVGVKPNITIEVRFAAKDEA